ncbi:hypothetical protein [Pseudoalteromonas lipolytica]
MYQKFKSLLGNSVYKSIALVLVILLAGPELMIGYELMALVEILGPTTFVLIHLVGIKLYFYKFKQLFLRFESHSALFLLTFKQLKTMPTLLYHILPERTFIASFLLSVAVGCAQITYSAFVF